VTFFFIFGKQVFVEALDRAFENVCELDLVFHFDEVRQFIFVRVSPTPLFFLIDER
jgi:hypothetical protein